MIVQIGPDSIFIIRHFFREGDGAYMVLLGSFPTVQFSKRQFPKSILSAALGPPACSSRGTRSPSPS